MDTTAAPRVEEIEEKFYDLFDTAQLRSIPEETRFWMLRTQKGYFYQEFVSQNFVALAWNLIDRSTDLSPKNADQLKKLLADKYEDIGRPMTSINKCRSFIYEVKPGDYIIIPSESSRFITIALAGEYYEDHDVTYEDECSTIKKIQTGRPTVEETACPYKKRRKITPLVSVPSTQLNYKLMRAISNYHGMSCLDEYAHYILSAVYQTYSFGDKAVITLWSSQTEPISPRMLSGLLYHSTNYFCQFVEEKDVSTKVNLNSEGPIQFVFEALQANFPAIAGFFTALCALGMTIAHLEKVPDFIKGILSIPADLYERYVSAGHKRKELKSQEEKSDQEEELRKIDICEKKLELWEKMKASGITPEALNAVEEDLIELLRCSNGMKIKTVAELPALTDQTGSSSDTPLAGSETSARQEAGQ